MISSNIKGRLIAMNFLEFAVWGAYLISMGSFLASIGMGANIGWFYTVQGIVSLFMPALVGIIADRWIPAQRMLSLCHLVAAGAMIVVGMLAASGEREFSVLFPWYTLSVAAYMPTLALSNSVSYNALEGAGLDTVKAFPPIRIFGTIGFIVSMWIVDLMGWQRTEVQFYVSAAWGLLLAAYALTLPHCPTAPKGEKKGLAEAFGLDAFRLFGQRKMALFFLFSMLLGVSLQITNAYANSFITSFAADARYAGAYFVDHANLLISLSQVSETLCILLIPFFLKRFGIKTVMLMAMLAWVLRFGFFAVGNPAFPGVGLFILSMIVYGVAFDFFNVSGSLFVDKEAPTSIRSSAQGLFMLMTNGVGASVGTLSAQAVVNHYVSNIDGVMVGNWPMVWTIFAAYALVVAVAFVVLFKEEGKAAA
ncbi:MAG: MFS transporter [Bacteroidaceae bacterium]|nr:MFS transporter [Bacteroidaceae bacterium]